LIRASIAIKSPVTFYLLEFLCQIAIIEIHNNHFEDSIMTLKKVTSLASMTITSALVLSACAFGNRKVDLTYPPKDYDQYKLNGSVSQALGVRKIALVVTDERSGDKKYLGEVRNGFYMHTADVVTEDNVQAWVQKAFTHELQRSGFTIVPANQSEAILKVAVHSIHCNAYWGYSADINLRLQFNKGPKTATTVVIEGFGSDGMNWAATSAGYSESLAKALADSYYRAGLNFLKPVAMP
jgi:hypothetical protein